MDKHLLARPKPAAYADAHSEALAEGLWLHVLPSKLTKSLTFGISITVPRAPRVSAHLTILRRCLLRATRSYPTLQALAQACDELYGANIRLNQTSYGNVQSMGASFTIPSPVFTGGGLKAFVRLRDIALEMLLDVDDSAPALDSARIEVERSQVMRTILAIKDNKQAYASIRARALAFRDRPIGIADWGNEVDLVRCKQGQLLDTWQRCITRGRVDVWVSGHGITDAVVNSLREGVADWPRGKLLRLPKVRPEPFEGEMMQAREETDGVQGYAVLGFTTGTQLGDLDFPALRVANACLGGLTTSRLFRHIREKLGLAYAVGSSADISTGIGECSAGCDRNKTKRVLDQMVKEFGRFRAHGITRQELDESVESNINSMLSASDSMQFYLTRKFHALLTGREMSLEYEVQALRELSVDHVNEFISRIKPCIGYQLA